MSLEEIFFEREGWFFCVRLWRCLLLCIVVFGSGYFHFVVRFNIACGAVLHDLWCSSMSVSVALDMLTASLAHVKGFMFVSYISALEVEWCLG